MKEGLEVNPTTRMLQIDFAENYSTMWQDEIQSAHWNKAQVTIFTSVYWQGSHHKSSIIISDDLRHTKESVITFIDHLITKMVTPTTVTTLQIWSDGPSSQFKNKFMAASVKWLAAKHGIDIVCNFFAASHCKGCVDGIGDTIKRQVANDIKQRRTVVKDAKSVYDCALLVPTSIDVHYINLEHIEAFASQDLNNVFENASNLAGIIKAHQLSILNDGVVMKLYSICPDMIDNQSLNPSSSNKQMIQSPDTNSEVTENAIIKVNDIVKIMCEPYAGYYAAVTNTSHGNAFEINYFERKDGKWILKSGDHDSREPHELIRVEAYVDNRGRYTFSK